MILVVAIFIIIVIIIIIVIVIVVVIIIVITIVIRFVIGIVVIIFVIGHAVAIIVVVIVVGLAVIIDVVVLLVLDPVAVHVEVIGVFDAVTVDIGIVRVGPGITVIVPANEAKDLADAGGAARVVADENAAFGHAAVDGQILTAIGVAPVAIGAEATRTEENRAWFVRNGRAGASRFFWIRGGRLAWWDQRRTCPATGDKYAKKKAARQGRRSARNYAAKDRGTPQLQLPLLYQFE
jgi:hypothetical protein